MATKKCIMAGAGTGKTTYLLNQALDIPREKNVLYLKSSKGDARYCSQQYYGHDLV